MHPSVLCNFRDTLHHLDSYCASIGIPSWSTANTNIARSCLNYRFVLVGCMHDTLQSHRPLHRSLGFIL